MSSRISSRVVPSAATEKACVWPRVKIAEPCVRGRPPPRSRCRGSRRGAAVGTLLVHGDALADDVLLELVEGELHAARWAAAPSSSASYRCRDRAPPRPPSWPPGARACRPPGWPRRARRRSGRGSGPESPVHLRRLGLGFAGLLAQVVLGLAEALDLGVGDVERVEDLRLGDLVGARLDHQDGLLGARDHEVERRLEQPLLVRVDEEVALGVLADAHGADGHREGMSDTISAALAPFIARMS